MADSVDTQRKKIKIENIDIIDVIRPSSTLEETCSVYIKEEDVKVEIKEPYQGKIINLDINNFPTISLDILKALLRYLESIKDVPRNMTLKSSLTFKIMKNIR